MKDELKTFQAWCSGTAYPPPSLAISHDKEKAVLIAIDRCILGIFQFGTKKEYQRAGEILIKSMRGKR